MKTIETLKADGFSMNYFKFGHGDKTFVMLPGLSVQGVMGFAEQIASAYQALTDDFTIYVFDPRNELPASYSVAEMAEDSVRAFQTLELDHIYLMGASMGGMTALTAAAHHPDMFEKLVAASSAVQIREEQFRVPDRWIRLARKGDAKALYLDFGEAVYPEETFKQLRDVLAEASGTVTEDELKRFVTLAEGIRGFDITNELDRIECPVLAVNDKEDHVFGAETAGKMEQSISRRQDWDFYLYDGYGHALYDTAPDFKERVLDFFLQGG